MRSAVTESNILTEIVLFAKIDAVPRYIYLPPVAFKVLLNVIYHKEVCYCTNFPAFI